MKRIYLAGRYQRRQELAAKAKDLEALGYEVTSRWLTGLHEGGESQYYRYAVEDLADVLRADTVINFTEEPNNGVYSTGGRHVEFGYAIAMGKGIIIVGPKENVFHHLEEIPVYDSWDSFLWAQANGAFDDYSVSDYDRLEIANGVVL